MVVYSGKLQIPFLNSAKAFKSGSNKKAISNKRNGFFIIGQALP